MTDLSCNEIILNNELVKKSRVKEEKYPQKILRTAITLEKSRM
jgi:hypothetical protein